jgi:hypothetical protein
MIITCPCRLMMRQFGQRTLIEVETFMAAYPQSKPI